MVDYKKFREAGLIAFPIDPSDKSPYGKLSWGSWYNGVDESVYNKVWDRYDGEHVAIACGSVCVVDVDSKNDPTGKIMDEFDQALRDQLDSWTYDALVIETSMSGGRHYWFKVPESMIEPSLILAKYGYDDADRFALGKGDEQKYGVVIETRGHRGYCVCHPSPKYDLIQGDIFKMVELQPDEIDLILTIARTFNTYEPPAKNPVLSKGLDRPGDWYNDNADPGFIMDMLEAAGWTCHKETQSRAFFSRPGTMHPRHTHADLAFDRRTFLNYSTNDSTFYPGQPYSFFSVLSTLKFGGNFTEAAKWVKTIMPASEPMKATDEEIEEALAGRLSLRRKPTAEFLLYSKVKNGALGYKTWGLAGPGMLVTWSGIEKSRKSTLLGAVMAAFLRVVFGIKIPGVERFPFYFSDKVAENSGPLLWVDTEQPEFWGWETMRRIALQCGLQDDDERFIYVSVVSKGPEERRAYIDGLVEKLKPAMLVVDGVTDLIWDPNDQKESTKLYTDHILKWQLTGAMVHMVIHNSQDGSLRGHIGKFLQRKCDCAMIVAADGETEIEITNKYARGPKSDAIRMQIGRDNIPYVDQMPAYFDEIPTTQPQPKSDSSISNEDDLPF